MTGHGLAFPDDWQDFFDAARAVGIDHPAVQNELCRRLARLVAGTVFRTVTRNGFCHQDAEDALQEVLLALLGSATRYDSTKLSPERFLRMVARRKLSTWVRKRRRGRWATGVDEVLDALAARDRDDGSDEGSESDEAIRLAEAVARLPVGYRAVIRLLLAGYSRRQVADALGIKPATLRQKVNRAIRRLRRLLAR